MTASKFRVQAITAALAVTAAACGSTAFAQSGEAGGAVVRSLTECRKLADDAARLACYDRTAAAFVAAEAKGDVVVVDREQAQKVRRQAFGFQLPSLTLFEKGAASDEIDTFDGAIATARRNGSGSWVFKLEDGAVWAQNGTEELFRTPKPGMKVRIRKATLGSFMMSIDGAGAFKAHRVE